MLSAAMDREKHADRFASLRDDAVVDCPYCGEAVALRIDPQARGTMVHDCEVCCQPWLLTIARDRDGAPLVEARTLDG